jgi:hypothetical protein
MAAGSVFDKGSEACHVALVRLRDLLLDADFKVDKKQVRESTLRAYPVRRHSYPLLNPRFVDRQVKGLEGTVFLEVAVLSKGDEALEGRLTGFDSPSVAFTPISE